jgi:hypothetical protein
MTALRLVNGLPLRRGTTLAVMTPGAAAVAASITSFQTALIGQSNMQFMSDGDGSSHYYNTYPQTRRSVDGVHHPVYGVDLTGTYPPGTPYFNGGWGNSTSKDMYGRPGDGVTTFVNKLYESTTSNVLIYEYAVQGTSIQQWMDDFPAGPGNCWIPFATAVKADADGINSAIWLQGESNAGTTKGDYKAFLRRLHNQLLTLSGKAAADFYFGLVILGPGTTAWSAEGTLGEIRKAQLEYIADPANVGAYLAGVATDMNLAGDGIHFNEVSRARMGARYAKALTAWQKGGAGAQGPKIASATRSGQGVTVTVQHAGGTSIKDGAGGTGTGALGFRFFDNGAPLAYTASSVSGPNTISLTLAAAPTGVLTMDYAMAGAPFGGTTAPASVIYDNDTVLGDTTGLPLQPCAAITVTGS